MKYDKTEMMRMCDHTFRNICTNIIEVARDYSMLSIGYDTCQFVGEHTTLHLELRDNICTDIDDVLWNKWQQFGP